MIDMAFRKKAVSTLTPKIGVYVLCDLDGVPIYVGQSVDGIRSRVRRHLTSARSDIIANRQIDVWEIAFVWTFPVENRADISPLEAALFHYHDAKSKLMNGKLPAKPPRMKMPRPEQVIQVMRSEEIAEKKEAALRLPRQAEHYSQIVAHFLAVKNSDQISRAMRAHFERLSKYHNTLLGIAVAEEGGDD